MLVGRIGVGVVAVLVAAAASPAPPGGALAAAPGGRLTPVEIATVVVRVESRGGGAFDGGAGVAVAPGVVLTAGHLVEGPHVFVVDCAGEDLDVLRVLRAADADLALVQVAAELPTVTLGTDPAAGDPTVVAGFPGGGGFRFVDGRIERYLGSGRQARVLRFSPMPEVGQSGGPLLDADGRLVGLAYARDELARLGYALPASRVRAAVSSLLAAETSLLVAAAWARGLGPLGTPWPPAAGGWATKAALVGSPLLPLLDWVDGTTAEPRRAEASPDRC